MTYIMGLSKRPLHLKSQEVMGQHMYACLGSPVDKDQRSYLRKTIH
jgi:hypothetical protein